MIILKYIYIVLILAIIILTDGLRFYTKEHKLQLREEVRAMFQHAYDGYLQHASEYDELRPLSCDGIDTWGSYSLTLIDALDTLATMGNFSEFRRVAVLLESKMNFDRDINVSVFETNIRIVGGLLSAHLLSKRAGLDLEEGWPCQGPLLRMAEDVARRLLPAFDTATGMPYGTVNLRYGVPKGETTVTCTAGVGTFLVEFGTLSRLTGNPIYEEVAVNAVYALWELRSPIGLFGNHIDIQSGRWTALDAGIGAGVDSFFEYLVKGAILLNRPNLLEMFHEARQYIDKYLKRDDWYVWAGMNKGQVTLPVFQSLEAFWPGILSMIGDTGPAIRTISKYSSIWRKYGFLPEFFNIPAGEASPNRESYPLRPELVESAMYLYRATNNQFLLELGENMLQSIEFSAKTKCGYATIRNVVTHEKENRMESFFLAETTKYLYLLFDEDNFLHNDASTGERLQLAHGECVINAGPYVFNTEAHPVDASALYCCHNAKEDIFDGLELDVFREDVMLKAERDKLLIEKASNTKYQCEESDVKAPEPQKSQQDGAQIKRPTNAGNLTVDIEVLDEHNNPADKILIENFERVKYERRIEGSDRQAKMVPNKQLTVTDLDEFFGMKRSHFKNASEVLNYVVAFMQNFTLDSSFINGLQIFDKNITAVLGSGVQKEYEARTRTLWELYVLQQQYAMNAQLVLQLNIMAFDDDNHELLDNVLKALNHNSTTFTVEESSFQEIVHKINMARLTYDKTLVNITAMQEFLLKILINGTMDKKRSYQPLLDDDELSVLKSIGDDTTRYQLFASVRRFVEFKKRMIETFTRLQTLMQEGNNKQQQLHEHQQSTAPTIPTPNDDLVMATTKNDSEVNTSNNMTIESPPISAAPKQDAAAGSSNNNDDASESVWSQLVQTILRKTTMQPTKFDADMLAQKTRESLQKYANQKMRHELFTCRSPKFTDKFCYREFYP